MSADRVKKSAVAKPRTLRVASDSTRKAPARVPVPADHIEFLGHAWAMEMEAVERYSMLADVMEQHNNLDVSELFRKLARIEQLHADRILEENPGMKTPVVPPGGVRWDTSEGPETADPGELHYRMQPYHALQIALACERRARDFFARIARSGAAADVRNAARQMAAEEGEHVRLIEDWLERTPVPRKDWDHDPDPPVQLD